VSNRELQRQTISKLTVSGYSELTVILDLLGSFGDRATNLCGTMDNDEIERASVLMERYRRKRARMMTPEERLDAGRKLTAQAFSTLMSNPEAYQRFIKRNHHQRRATNAKRLERELLGSGNDASTD
jgi:hypothetical protein